MRPSTAASPHPDQVQRDKARQDDDRDLDTYLMAASHDCGFEGLGIYEEAD